MVKFTYVEIVQPMRVAGRDAAATGSHLAELVPANETLYLCKLKDEGIMFYYARPVRRFAWDTAPESGYAILLASEWAERQALGQVTLLAELRDQQQAPIYLVRIERSRCHSPMVSKR